MVRRHTTGPVPPVARIAPVAPINPHRPSAAARLGFLAIQQVYRDRLRLLAKARKPRAE